MIVAVGSVEQLRTAQLSPGTGAVELRLDLSNDVAAASAVAAKLRPRTIFATCRLPRDGGRFTGTESDRLKLLNDAAQWADFVDIEDGVACDVPEAKTLRSLHDFKAVPADLDATLAKLRKQGGALFKLAATATCLADNLRIRDFLRDKSDVAAFCMGEYGVPSRVLALSWGSQLTFGSVDGQQLAPGMFSATQLEEEFRAAHITAATQVFGVTGLHVAYSLSPRLHNRAMRATGFDGVYLPLPARDFADFQQFAARLPLAGASVTVPFKEAAAAIDPSDAIVGRIGAANTLQFAASASARNTDSPGFLADLRAHYGRTLLGRRAFVLGAGGSARAVVHALASAGVRVDVWARREEQARSLVPLGARSLRGPDGRYDLLVNTTPCGMTGEHAEKAALPWPALQPHLAADSLVYDLVYTPPETPLLKLARDAGFAIANGWGMLQRQAAAQAEHFGYAMRHSARQPGMVHSHVWLVGYRASGKSTLAPLIAARLGRVHRDLDQEIEKTAGVTVGEIFTRDGEPGFRLVEADTAATLAETSPDAVIATGGGIVERPDNIRTMRDNGVVVYLDAPENLLLERLATNAGGRPSLTGKPVAEEVREVLARRRPLYEAAAHITIRADRPPQVLAGEIVARLAQFNPDG